MDLFPAEGFDDVLAELSEKDPLGRKIGELRRQSRDIPRRWVCVEPEEQIRAREMEKAQGMGLHNLPHMKQFPELVSRRSDLDTENGITGLC
jgi:hypothetical protein